MGTEIVWKIADQLINNFFVDRSYLLYHGVFEASTIELKQKQSIYYPTISTTFEPSDEIISSGCVASETIPTIQKTIEKKRKSNEKRKKLQKVKKEEINEKIESDGTRKNTRKKPNKWTKVSQFVLFYL